MVYYDTVVSGKGVSLNISNGDSAYNTTVRAAAALRVSAGGYVETTTVFGTSTTVLNAGLASSTVLSGGTMMLLEGGSADVVSVLRNGKLTVSNGGVATGVYVSDGIVNASAVGGDTVTRIEGTHESGVFSLSGGVASNFRLNPLAQLTVLNGGIVSDTVVRSNAKLNVSYGGVATGIIQDVGGGVNATIRGGDTTTVISGYNVSGTFSLSNGVAKNFILYENIHQHVSKGGVALHTIVSSNWGHQYVHSGGIASDTTVYYQGSMTVYDSGVARDAMIYAGGSMVAAGGSVYRATIQDQGLLWVSAAPGDQETKGSASLLSDFLIASGGTVSMFNGARFFDLVVASGALVKLISGAVLAGSKLDIAKDTIYYGDNMLGMTVSNGEVLNLGADGKAYDISFGSGVTVTGAMVADDETLTVSSGAVLKNVTVASGGFLTLAAGADTGERLYFDFSDPSGGVIETRVNDLSLISPETALCLVGLSGVGSYAVASGSAGVVCCMPDELYENRVSAGGSYTNAFSGRTYELDAAGQTVTVSDFTVVSCSSATSVNTSGAQLNEIDLAAVWTDFSVSSGAVVYAVNEYIEGGAWLKLEGTNLSGARLFGTEDGVEIDGCMNIMLTSGAVVGNLAAGAGGGGGVGGVKLTIDSATLDGVGYAGGFGDVGHYETEYVYDDVATYVRDGVFNKDFYAGALANYKSTETFTDIGDVTLTVDSGRFCGNLYGASAVKVGDIGDTNIHSVLDVNVTLNGGEAEKEEFCLFAGGYATGSTGQNVYEAKNVTVDIAGGEWGGAHGGRGIFGGAMASGVRAEVGNVDITISGGTMGNVFGGGWAQKGGVSEVGNVSITIKGGTVANVLGGGSHSTSGGTTVAKDVTITVSGGAITNAIYARGLYEGDTAGSADVIFTGSKSFNFADGVYGYSKDNASGDATLTFDAYTGTFTGGIGGFDSITLDGKTAMTLTAAENGVSNTTWMFDLTDRSATLARTSLLTWSDGDFTGDTIKLNLADDNTNAWDLVTTSGNAVYNKFDVQIDGISILGELIDIDDVISGTGTDYDGWGFTDDNGTLKFKQLA